MLHFAYGSNMSVPMMRRRCPAARLEGRALLPGYRVIITREGYASILSAPGACVHGVLWRLTPRDLAALNAYESLGSGLYSKLMLPVRKDGRRMAATLYVARARSGGRPRPGYLDVILAAAREWSLPPPYVRSLQRWQPSRWRGARAAESGELG